MKRLVIILSLLCVILTFSFSQTIRFNKVYADTVPFWQNVVELDSGYICVGGAKNSINELNVLVSFIDTLGNQIWNKKYGFASNDTYHGRDNSLVKTYDGGFAICGTVHNVNENSYAPLLIKFDNNFDTIWTKQYLKDSLYFTLNQCIQTLDSGFVLVGYKEQSYSTQNTDISLIRTDKNGNIVWIRTYGVSYLSERAFCISHTKDNGFIIGGWKGDQTNAFSGDYFIVRTDSLGDINWTNVFGSSQYDDYGLFGVCTTSDSCYIFTGHKVYYADAGTNSCTARIFKMDDSHNIIWDKEYENQGEGVGFAHPIELDDNNIIATGTYSNFGQLLNTLYKLTPNGNEIWHRYLGYPNGNEMFTYANAISATHDKGFVLAGFGVFWDLTPMQQARLIKVDSCGCDTAGCICDYVNAEEIKKEDINVIIYPNPTTGEIIIDATEFGKIERIEVYNSSGTKLQDGRYNERKIKIDLSSLSKSIYLIKVSVPNGVFMKKIIIE